VQTVCQTNTLPVWGMYTAEQLTKENSYYYIYAVNNTPKISHIDSTDI